MWLGVLAKGGYVWVFVKSRAVCAYVRACVCVFLCVFILHTCPHIYSMLRTTVLTVLAKPFLHNFRGQFEG